MILWSDNYIVTYYATLPPPIYKISPAQHIEFSIINKFFSFVAAIDHLDISSSLLTGARTATVHIVVRSQFMHADVPRNSL